MTERDALNLNTLMHVEKIKWHGYINKDYEITMSDIIHIETSLLSFFCAEFCVCMITNNSKNFTLYIKFSFHQKCYIFKF